MRGDAQIELGSVEKKRNAAGTLPHGKSEAGVHEFIENHCVPLKNEIVHLNTLVCKGY